MNDLYNGFENLSDGEKLALKNADIALESGDFKKFEAANSLAEKYNSKNFYDKIGLDTDAIYSLVETAKANNLNVFQYLYIAIVHAGLQRQVRRY